MLNEGIIVNDSKTLIKSAMIRELHRLGATDPDSWERAVFKALTGSTREDVNWEKPDNQAGYYVWIKEFDALIEELAEDGYVLIEHEPETGKKRLLPTDNDPDIEISQLVYPN